MELTFADLLDAVRLCRCRAHFFSRHAFHSAWALFSDDEREQLIQLLTAPFGNVQSRVPQVGDLGKIDLT